MARRPKEINRCLYFAKYLAWLVLLFSLSRQLCVANLAISQMEKFSQRFDSMSSQIEAYSDFRGQAASCHTDSELPIENDYKND
ncbi:hypothetical protein FHT76_000407 [Rhizobium sp. BK176]|nr:hypothetical protein [Rhizobium sp. BK176]